MILLSLYKLAKDEGLVPDRDFPLVPVARLVTITRDGRIAGITDTRVDVAEERKKPKLVAKSFPVPYQTGRSGTKAPPAFFVDNAKYVFGVPTTDKPFSAEEGAEKSAWFREQVAACVLATNDDGARAVLAMLESIARGEQNIQLPDDCRSNDLFAFIYEPDGERLVHQRPAVADYWRQRRRQQEEPATDALSNTFECVVTGDLVAEPALFPKVKYVPGGQTAGTPLVSFNASAFGSYGLEGNENAPVSREAAEYCSVALQRLLHPAFPDPRPDHGGETLRRRNYRLNSETVACYWSDSRGADGFLNAFSDIFEPDPAAVAGMYQSVWRGLPPPIQEPGNFFALILSGVQGRMAVRDWFTTTVTTASANLARHFTDLRIVRNSRLRDGELPDIVPLHLLLESLSPFGRADGVPPNLAAEIFAAAVRGTPYPFSILQRALERMRAEMSKSAGSDLERRDARASLIKAVLNRRRHQYATPNYPELTVALDPSNTNPGYLCGRLMAIIERLQDLALPDVNAGVVDRFFAAASVTPRGVFTRLLRNARHHARKALEEPKRRGTARWLDSQVDEIASHFDVRNNGFPAFLDIEQQGLFVLGYHQQRHEFSRKRDSRPAENAPDSSDTALAVTA
jgi:CRISPR-associated protein Csd1